MRREDKILVVEDNPVIARSIEERFRCDHASDGWEAISKLESEEYAAIVIDADVSRHSGYGVLTYLREEVGEELDNVIVLTSSDRGDVQRRIGNSPHVVNKADAVAEITKLLG